MNEEKEEIYPPYDPTQWDSRKEYDAYVALGKQRREEQRIFTKAMESDPTIKIHVWPNVIHPTHEQRTAWLRPGNAFTQATFGILPFAAIPPHELLEHEKKLHINQEPYLTASLLVNSSKSDEPDFANNVEALLRKDFSLPDEKITLIIHDEILWLDRAPARNAYGVE